MLVLLLVAPGVIYITLATLGLAIGTIWDVFDWVRNPGSRRRRSQKKAAREWVDDWYDDRHREERKKYAETIALHGGQCMEHACVMPSRRIEPGAYWHLAHDHQRGGQHDYLGPAHPECNRAEARSRGALDDEGSTHDVANDYTGWADTDPPVYDDHP